MTAIWLTVFVVVLLTAFRLLGPMLTSRERRAIGDNVRFQPCDSCGEPVAHSTRGAIGGPPASPHWFEYSSGSGTRTWLLHNPSRCEWLARQRTFSALTDEDREWLKTHGWNGR